MLKRLETSIRVFIKHGLALLQSLFKTDVRYVFKNGSWLFFERVVVLLVSFAVSVLFANYIPQDVYGGYKYLISVGGLLTIFSLTGLDTTILRSISKGYEGSLLQSVKLYFTWSWGIAVSGILLSSYYFYFGNYTLGGGLLIIALATPVIQGFSMARPYLSGKKLFKAASRASVVYALIPNLCLIAAILLTDNLIAIIASFFVSGAIVSAIQFFYIIKTYPPNTQVDPHSWELGKHMSVIVILSIISVRLDSILLFQWVGSTHLAFYSFAIAIPEMIRGSFKVFHVLAVPKIAQNSSTNLNRQLLKKSYTFLLLSLPITVAYIFAAPSLFALFFPAYEDAVIYSQVFAITICLNALFGTAFFESRVAIKYRYALSFFSTLANVIPLIPFIYFFGVWGAIYSKILTRVLIVLFTSYLLYRYKPTEA